MWGLWAGMYAGGGLILVPYMSLGFYCTSRKWIIFITTSDDVDPWFMWYEWTLNPVMESVLMVRLSNWLQITAFWNFITAGDLKYLKLLRTFNNRLEDEWNLEAVLICELYSCLHHYSLYFLLVQTTLLSVHHAIYAIGLSFLTGLQEFCWKYLHFFCTLIVWKWFLAGK